MIAWVIALSVFCAFLVGVTLGQQQGVFEIRTAQATWRSEALLRQRVCDRALDLASRDKYVRAWALTRATAEEGRRP